MSRSVKTAIVIVLIVFTLILLVGVAFYFYKTLNNTEVKKVELSDIENLQIAGNLPEMVEQSEIIAIGSYEGLYSTMNLARDDDDITKESTEWYIGGKIFRFKVEELLKGDINEDTIKIAHTFSLPFPIEETLGYKDEEVEDVDPTYIKPAFHTKFIVFLNHGELDNMYIRSIEPFLIRVDETQKLEVKSNIIEEIDFEDTITGTNLADFKSKIN